MKISVSGLGGSLQTFLALADGHGDTHVSCVHLDSGATIRASSRSEAATLLIVHARITITITSERGEPTTKTRPTPESRCARSNRCPSQCHHSLFRTNTETGLEGSGGYQAEIFGTQWPKNASGSIGEDQSGRSTVRQSSGLGPVARFNPFETDSNPLRR